MSMLIAVVILIVVVVPLTGWAVRKDRRLRRLDDARGVAEEEVT